MPGALVTWVGMPIVFTFTSNDWMLKGSGSDYRIDVIIKLNINEESCPNDFVQNAALK